MKDRSKKTPPFVSLLRGTIKTGAWRATSHGARSLYVSLKAYYNRNLENSVFISSRDAAEQLGSNRAYVRRWFRELEYYGFIALVSPGGLGIEGKGKAPHWRLTDEPHLGKAPTREFEKWAGEKFHEQKSPKHYIRKKQNPGTSSGPTVGAVVVPVVGHKLVPPGCSSGAQTGPIEPDLTGAQTGPITSSTTPMLVKADAAEGEG
jgi:hypothetical protein